MSYDPSNYLAKFPPQPPSGDDGTRKELKIDVALEIFQIDSVNLQEYSFKAKFDIIVFWHEYRFQNLLNLRGDPNSSHQNSLSEATSKQLWIPPIEFSNSQGERAFLKYEGGKSVIEVVRSQNSFMLAGIDSYYEARIFDPTQNKLKLRNSYKMSFTCNFDLDYYPFDIQHCFIKVWNIVYYPIKSITVYAKQMSSLCI